MVVLRKGGLETCYVAGADSANERVCKRVLSEMLKRRQCLRRVIADLTLVLRATRTEFTK
jgi:hypothetical protein